MKNIAYIISRRKTQYKNYLEETVNEGNCYQCNEIVIYGNLVMEEAKKNKKIKEIKFICNECYKKQPKYGKLQRPSQEMIEQLRKEGHTLDEITIRKIMKRIKNKEGIP